MLSRGNDVQMIPALGVDVAGPSMRQSAINASASRAVTVYDNNIVALWRIGDKSD